MLVLENLTRMSQRIAVRAITKLEHPQQRANASRSSRSLAAYLRHGPRAAERPIGNQSCPQPVNIRGSSPDAAVLTALETFAPIDVGHTEIGSWGRDAIAT